MPISLETLRLLARRLPSMSTITMSEVRILPLLMQVGVTSRRSSSRRTDRFPSVAATKPFSCSRRPNCTIPARYWRSLAIGKSSRGHVTARLGNLTTVKIYKYKATNSHKRSGGGPPASNPIISSMLVSDFHYDLPPDRIAQEPLPDRAGSRLLHLSRPGSWQDRSFRDFPAVLRSDDLLVLNNTRVFPARLYG